MGLVWVWGAQAVLWGLLWSFPVVLWRSCGGFPGFGIPGWVATWLDRGMKTFLEWAYCESSGAGAFIGRFVSLVGASPSASGSGYAYMDGDAEVSFDLRPGFLGPGAVQLGELRVVPGRTGAGGRFMGRLVGLADEAGTLIELNSVPLRGGERIPLGRLASFYGSFGFLPIGDSQGTMFRRPS